MKVRDVGLLLCAAAASGAGCSAAGDHAQCTDCAEGGPGPLTETGTMDATSGPDGEAIATGPDAGAAEGGPSDEPAPGCAPVTCAARGAACGTAADGCGRLLTCASCAAPQFCGGAGAHQCGGNVTAASGDPSIQPVAIAAGEFSTCALLSNGTVKCWGYNMYGQLGDGTNSDSATPVAVEGLAGATAIDAWDGYHACAILSSGHAQCWGSAGYGALGNGGAVDSSVIKDVSVLTRVATISAGANSTCAAQTDGTAWCWGEQALFDGRDLTVPTQVPGLTGVANIVASWNDVCALLANGTVACIGANGNGQIGDATVDPDPTHVVSTLRAVTGLSHVTAVVAGIEDECALLSDGTVQCWGADTHGQLGNAATIPGDAPPYGSATPVPVTGLAGATAVAVGGEYACALLSDGAVKCWGDNEYGTLGNGTTVDSSVPVAVSGLSHVVAISASVEHACALLADGTVDCWGMNDRGQLGSPPGAETCSSAVCSMTPIAVVWGMP